VRIWQVAIVVAAVAGASSENDGVLTGVVLTFAVVAVGASLVLFQPGALAAAG